MPIYREREREKERERERDRETETRRQRNRERDYVSSMTIYRNIKRLLRLRVDVVACRRGLINEVCLAIQEA